jgi:hypoxanthine phosphoribosyltransferase
MTIKDLEFQQFINKAKIQQKVRDLAELLNADYAEKTPVFLPVLNGAFMFAADLIKQVDVPCKVSFVKLSSYMGTVTSGQVKSLIGVEESLFGQHVVVVEDIVDTGITLRRLVEDLRGLGAKSVEVAALLRKQPARESNFHAKYIGFEIGDEFVVGYGLDYEGLGRNLKDIYKVKAQK